MCLEEKVLSRCGCLQEVGVECTVCLKGEVFITFVGGVWVPVGGVLKDLVVERGMVETK